jgi:hypothetical protein
MLLLCNDKYASQNSKAIYVILPSKRAIYIIIDATKKIAASFKNSVIGILEAWILFPKTGDRWLL